MTRPEYRPDIDGLRAVAVLLVLVYHSGLPYLPGGYTGVDVFFVISGFLITSIIHREAAQGTFSYAHFYRRRILRLLPATLGMLVVTTVGALVFLLPSDLVRYGKSVAATMLAVSNLYFWRENGGYFQGTVDEVPLLHTWSLAVEEQYYLIWPLFVLALHRFLPRRSLQIGGTAALFVFLLVFSEWATRRTFGAAYYLLPTRMFELMLGSGLAIGWDRMRSLPQRIGSGLSILGLALILLSARWLNESSPFPGLNALGPVLGTGLLIVTGRDRVGIVNRWLSARPVVFIGLISYSLYLWHWPLIVFVRYVGFELTTAVSWGLIVASTVLAWLSWRFVERPFRGPTPMAFPTALKRLYLVPTVLAVLAAVGLKLTDGLPGRFDPPVVRMEAAIEERPGELRRACHASVRDHAALPSDACWFGASGDSGPRALLIGDSHANHYTGFLDELAKSAGVRMRDYTMDQCSPVAGWGRQPRTFYAEACRRRNEIGRAHTVEAGYDFVILGANWPTGHILVNPRATVAERDARLTTLMADLQETLRVIVSSGATPILLKDTPRPAATAKCPVFHAAFGRGPQCESPRREADIAAMVLDSVLRVLGAEFPTLVVVDPKEVMCDADRCYAAIDGVPLFLDAAHLNDAGSRAAARAYLRQEGNPFTARGSSLSVQ